MTERVEDELVVYDVVSQKAHSLSAPAAAVWERCDGLLSVEIARELTLEPIVVEQALNELRECGLLDEGPISDSGYSRREAAAKLAKAGGVAVSAPLIYSIAIPSAAAALSCQADGTTEPGCTASPNGRTAPDSLCCSNLCYRGQGGALTCVPAGCLPSGTTCATGSQCCSGVCLPSNKCRV